MIALLLLLFSHAAAAHDFWVQPDDFRCPSFYRLMVGHGPDRQVSPIPARRIVRSETIDGIAVLETDNKAQSHLPAPRFNDYLRAEGLMPALELRQRTQRMQTDGSEIYSRHAKAILQSAKPAQIGMILEIVPEADPYSLPDGAALPVRLYFRGLPLPGAQIKLTDLGRDDVPFATGLTDPQGRARFTMPRRGAWLLSTVWTEALAPERETDFETFFSSLSFGFDKAGPPPVKC